MKLHALDPLLYPDEDRLHRDFVEHFYNLITRSVEPPYAISVDGLWGTGKTTIMKTLQGRLREAYYPVVWFNPWEYRQSDNVVLAFLRKIAGQHKDLLREMSDSGKSILHVLVETAMDVSLNVLTNNKLSLDTIKKLFTSSEEQHKPRFVRYDDVVEEIKEEFVELIERISNKNEYGGKPVIIFFDDLDRCLPDDTIKLLEALKNLFVTKVGVEDPKLCNCIFICGIDTHIAKQFIRQHYHKIEDEFAINYFRKIFNLTLSMPQSPKLQDVLRDYLKDFEDVLPPQQADALANMVSVRGYQIELSSIRKYLNVLTNFCVFLKFNPNYTFTPEDDDFVINLLLLKEAWQPLYEEIRQEALRERTNMGRTIQNIITAYEDKEDEKLSPGQKAFLTDYVGENSSFKDEHLSLWLSEYPTLA